MTGPTLDRRLREARRRSFVGRQAELALFRESISAPEPSPCVLWLFGPGGVGKSALLDAFAAAAGDEGRAVVALDMRGVDPSPAAFRAELGTALDGLQRPVLLIDTFEAAAGLEDWLRDEFLPGLPADVMIVVAGRSPPGPEWRRDAGWRDLLRVVSLRNLDREDGRALLAHAGVDPVLHERCLDVTHGHPLALTLLADGIERHGDATLDLAGAPDVLTPLVAGFLDGVPDARHRLALAVAAQARFTTASLLRRVAGDDDGDDLFAWLRDLSFVDATPRGLCPHDLAREAIDAELRWRDPEAHADVHTRVREAVLAEIASATARARQAAMADLIHLHRGNPAAPSLWDWDSLGRVYADELGPGDREAVLAMVARHEGEESAAIIGHWLERQPAAFAVFRAQAGERVGFLAQLALHEASAADIAADPGAAAAWTHAARHAPPGASDEVLLARTFMDADAYQGPSRSLNVVTLLSTDAWLGRGHLSWYYIAVADADAMAPMMAYVHFGRAPDADFVVGGRTYAVFARDWRREGAVAWLQRMEDRELATQAPPERPPVVQEPVMAISRGDFADAVRRGLRDLHRPDALTANPLLRSRLVREGPADGDPAAALRALLEEAVAAVGEDARDERLARALECTFVRPAPTQEAAAELLGLPFSTYRGHLTRGTDRVVDRLWQRELYGAA
jgi:hypothetical protein